MLNTPAIITAMADTITAIIITITASHKKPGRFHGGE
jgi:hypothetical protein